jgi:uncharacterized repeat protein (TIGR01451 family)
MNMGIRVFVRAVVVLAMVSASASAFGATVTWNAGGGTEFWSNPLNWSGNSVPTSGDDVIIANAGTSTVRIDVNATVNSITVQNGTNLWIVTGQLLTVNNAGTIDFGGALALEEASTFSGNGALTVNGTLHIFGGTVGGSGALTINSGGWMRSWAGVNSSTISRTTTNNTGGHIDFLDAGPGSNFTFGGATLTNTGTIGILTDHDINAVGSPVLLNNNLGVISKSLGSGTAAINFTVNNAAGATIQAQSGTLALNGDFTLSSGGSIIGAGDLHVSGQFIWAGGTISGSGARVLTSTSFPNIGCNPGNCLLDGATLRVQTWADYQPTFGAALVFSNGASLIIDPGKTLSINNDRNITDGGGAASSIINNGTIYKTITSGTSTIGVPVTLSGTSTVNIITGTLKFAGGADVASGATIDIAAGKTLEVTGGVFLFNSGSVPMPGSGTFKVSGGTLRVPTGITMTIPNVTLQASGVIDGGGTLVLSGPSSWTGGTMGSASAPGGVTQINSGNTLSILGSSAPQSLTQNRQLLNGGTVSYGAISVNFLTMSGGSKITNNGTLNLINNHIIGNSPAGTALIENNGTLARSSGTGGSALYPRVENNNGATLSAIAGTSIDFNGGGIAAGVYAIPSGATFTLAAGTFTVASTSTVTGAGNLQIAATIDISSGANVTWPNVQLSGGTIAGAGALHVSGTFNWIAGTIAGSGPRVLDSTSTPTFSCGICALDGAALQLQASATYSGSNFQLTTGASLTISAGKTLSITNNGGFVGGLGGSVINNGTIWKETAAGTSTIGVPVTLSGTSTIDLDAGTLQFSGGADVASGATIDIAGGTTLEVVGGVFVFNSGPVSMPGSGTFKLSAGTLRVPTSVTVTVPSVTFQNGVIDGGGTLILSGTNSWIAGTMGSTAAPGGVTQISGGSTLDLTIGNVTLTQGRELQNSGTVNYGGTSNLILFAASKITNNAAFNITADRNINFSGSATIDNNGTLTKSGGTGNSTLLPPVNNAGTVSVTAGTFAFAGGGTNSGSFNITAPGNLSFPSGTETMSGGSINGTGTLTVNGATVTVGVPVNVGALNVSFGTATLNANASANAFTMTGGTLGGSGTLTLNNGGTWTGGTMSGSGTTINPATKILNIPTPVTFNGRTLQNDGTLTVSGNVAGSGTIANNGILNSVGNITISAPMNNSGQVTTSAVLSLGGNGSHSGTFNANVTGSVIDFSGGTQTISGPLAGSGKFRFSGAAATVNGAWSGMAIDVTGGSVALNTSGTIPALTLSGGTLAGSGNVTVSGPSTWSGGTIGGSGALTFGAGATVAMPGTSAMTLARPLLNNGIINFAAASSAMLIDGVPVTNSGTFDIQSSQSILVTAGTPPFSNSGTLKKSAGAGVVQFAAPLMNSGVVEIDAGTLNVSGTYAQSAGTTDVRPGATLQTATLALNGGSLTGNGTIAGNVDNHAVVAPGASPGTLTINGNYTQASNGVLDIQIGGTAPGTQYDRLLVSGNVTLDGTLNVSTINSFVPAAGNAFQILTFGARPGSTTFAVINGLDYGSGSLVPAYSLTDLQLIVTTSVQADLAASVGAPPSAANGSVFAYTVNIVNHGGSDATAVAFSAVLPPNVTFIGASPAICSGAPNLVCTVGALLNQSAAVVVLNVTANGAGAAPIFVSVAGNELDPNTANNAASASPSITSAADLGITIAGTASTVAGSRAIYTIIVTNGGPEVANNVAVSAAASPGLTFSANSGACTGSFPCTLGA